MKHALIATSLAAMVAGLGFASGQGVNEPQKGPAAADGSSAPQTSTENSAATGPHAGETTGQAPSEAAAINAAEEEARSAADARRVRAAVGRTLERTRELSRSELSRSASD